MLSNVTAYTTAIIPMAACLLVAAGIAMAVPYKPNNPGTGVRKAWFWIMLVVGLILGFLFNFLVCKAEPVSTIFNNYLMHAGIAAFVSAVFYIALGFVLAKIMPKSKIASWF